MGKTGFLMALAAFWGIFSGQLLAQTVEPQVALVQKGEFKQIQVLPGQVHEGILGIAIQFQLNLAFEGQQILEKGEGTRPYAILAHIFDQDGMPLAATSDAKLYQGSGGFCRDSMVLYQGPTQRQFNDEAMFIPYFAMAMDQGERRGKLQLEVRDLKMGRTIGHSALIELSFDKPATKLVRLTVEQIIPDSTDANGELWDFKFLNPKDVAPDIFWTIRRGGTVLFQSEKQKNQQVYQGGLGDVSPWLLISEGDQLQFAVYDFDLLGYSDGIGSTALDYGLGKVRNGVPTQYKFDQVKVAKLVMDAVALPRVKLSNLEIVENTQERGVTGLLLRFKYELDQPFKQAVPLLEVRIFEEGEGKDVRLLRVVKGPAVPLDGHLVELTSGKGEVELFVPHYGLPLGKGEGKNPLCLLLPMVKIGQQQVSFPRYSRQMVEIPNAKSDFGFGQWKMAYEERNGCGGLAVNLEYTFPNAYFEDNPEGVCWLQPLLQIDSELVDLSKLPVDEAHAPFWDGQVLKITAANRNENLKFFIPSNLLPAKHGEVVLAARYKASFEWPGREAMVGESTRQASLALPKMRRIHFGLKEAAAKREAWMITDPNLYWVLKLGDFEIYRSSVVYNRKDAKWDEEEISFVAAPRDKITLQVFHEGVSNEEDRLLETWRVTAANMPDKAKGSTHLHPNTLKKFFIRSYFEE